MHDRYVVKKLRDLALKEFREKRPNQILGIRVKKSVLLQRGFGPSIILSGLNGQAVPFLLLADYGEYYRLYYFLENGIMLNAINIPRKQFEREQLKFEKATKKLFQFPKPQIPERKLEHYKQRLNTRFKNYLNSIEKQTSCKLPEIPLITIYQSPLEDKLVIKRERNFIKIPIELVTHELIDGFLLREAYRLVFPSFIKETEQELVYRLIGAYHFLPKSIKPKWLVYWSKKYPLKDLI
ncbi:MAG: hypothetical protein ACTSYB_02255, partial [Candidatus Helarchaeota archaeon]